MGGVNKDYYSVKLMSQVFYTMFGLEYEDIKMHCMFSETDGDVTTVDFKKPGFIDMRRSRIVVPAGVRVTHISATIDGKEVCSGPLDLQPHKLQAYEP